MPFPCAPSITVAMIAAAALAGSCIVEPWRVSEPLCELEVEPMSEEVVAIPAEIWIAVLLANFDLPAWTTRGPARDCTGRPPTQPSEPSKWGPGCHLPELGAPQQRERLSAGDVQISDAPRGASLAWVSVDRYDGGLGSGPVGLLEFDVTGVNVETIGTLRAPRQNMRMRVESGWLFARSERCDLGDCVDVVQLLALADRRFETLALELDGGPCVVPASLALVESEQVEGPDGRALVHRLEREPSVATDGTPVIRERLSSQVDGEPPRERVRELRLTLDGRTLRGPASLWSERAP